MNQKERARLTAIIKKEIESPGAYSDVLNDLKGTFPENSVLFRFLVAKDDQHRHAFYLKSQHVWYRKLGWKIMRPIFVVGILGAVLFSLQRVIDPTLGVACFIAGGASFYVVLQLFAHRWATKELKSMDGVDERYKKNLETLLREGDWGK